jgi:hypothetical protein
MIPGRDPRVSSKTVGLSQIAVDQVEPELGVVAMRGEHDLHTAERLAVAAARGSAA